MNLAIIALLDSLIRTYWRFEIDEYLQSLDLSLTKNENENIKEFLKRINSEGRDLDIITITNSLLVHPTLEADNNLGRQIANKPVSEWVFDLLSLFEKEGYDTTNGEIKARETSSYTVSTDAARPTLGPDQLREIEIRRNPQQGNQNESPSNDAPSNGVISGGGTSGTGNSSGILILKIILGIIGIIAVGSVIYISIDIDQGDNMVIDSPDSITDSPGAVTDSPGSIVNSPGASINPPEGKNKEPSIDTIIETYRETQPYSIEWTKCGGPIHESTKEGETISWTMHFTPIILDKDRNPSLIPFHTIFSFGIREFDMNNSPMDVEEIKTSMHLVNPESRAPIVLDLTEFFESAQSNEVFQIRIWLLEEKLAPYSSISEKNLLDYSTKNRQEIMTDIRYYPESADWLKLDESHLVCSNLLER